MVPHVLLIEDDPSVARATILGLERLGHAVHHRLDGMGALETDIAAVDVIVLDIGLPGDDGFAVCRRIRTISDVPIVILTARGDEIDTVVGLESGADDYVAKPVSPRVLDARIKAVLRRSAPAAPGKEADSADNLVVLGAISIDRRALEVRKAGELVALSPTEIRLLLTLTSNVGHVLSRQQLLRAVWDQDFLGDSRIVDAAVQRLRAKIEDDPATPTMIETVRGFGYRCART